MLGWGVLLVSIIGCADKIRIKPSSNSVNINEKPSIRENRDYLSHQYAKVRKKQVQSVDYKLSVRFDEVKDSFMGTATVNFSMVKGNLSPLTIDFDKGTVKSILVNEKQVSWDYNQWFITLAADLFREGNNTIKIDYSRPYSTDGYGIHRFKEKSTGNVYIYSHFEPYKAHRFFPHFDQPNLRATYTIDVVAPKSWQVITSILEERVEELESTKHWFFPQSANFSSYVLPMHAGPYKVWHDKAGEIPLRLFARQSIAPYVKLNEWFKPTKQTFKFFQEYFDIPYPFVKYDQVISPDYNIGAMENIAAVTFNESFISRGEKTRSSKRRLANTIAHEMAHMWFGNLVTMDWWNGLWLKESFATYMANLALGESTEYKEVWDAFYSGTEQWAYSSDQSVTTHAIELPVATTSDAYTNFDGITYGKGASVLRQLPFYLGEDAFRQGVSNYLKKYAYQATTLSDFMTELGNVAQQDLTEWQQQWLFRAGVNTIKVNYQCENDKVKSMSLIQTAPEKLPTLRSQRVQIGLYQIEANSAKLSVALPVTYSGKFTNIASAKNLPCPDAVYPNYDDWGFVKVELDEKTIKTLEGYINTFPKVKTRLMLWQSLWDSVRDAKLSVLDYVNFSINNLQADDDLNIVSDVSSSLSASFSYIGFLSENSQTKKKYRSDIENFFWQKTINAQPKSDLQKNWFSYFVSTAHTPNGLKKLIDLLSEKIYLDGLTIDQDRRWQLIQKLNQYEFGEYDELLKIERQKDDSDKGMKNALATEVIRPNVKTKEKWLKVLIEQPQKYKLSTARYIMEALFPSSQVGIHAKFSQQILTAIPMLDKKVEQAFTRSFSSYLAPSLCTSDSVKKLAEANKMFSTLNPSIVKSFKRTHQNDERCVNILNKMQEGV